LGCWPDGVANPIHFEETGESRDKRREEKREERKIEWGDVSAKVRRFGSKPPQICGGNIRRFSEV